MASKIFASQPLFSHKKNKNNSALCYILHALFLQNCEYIIQKKEDLSSFINYVEVILTDEKLKKALKEKKDDLAKFLKQYENSENSIGKFLQKFKNIDSLNKLYETIQCLSNESFFNDFHLIIQKLLLLLVLNIEDDDENLHNSKHFQQFFNCISKSTPIYDEVMILIFLKFLEKNCRLYTDKSTQKASNIFTVDEGYPYLFLYYDDQKNLKFAQLSELYDKNLEFYKKTKIDEDVDELFNPLEKEQKSYKKSKKIIKEFISNLHLENLPEKIPNVPKVMEKIQEKINEYFIDEKRNMFDEEEWEILEKKKKKIENMIKKNPISKLSELKEFLENQI